MSAEPIGIASASIAAERGAARHLRKAMLALARGHGAIGHHAEKPWASITFSGSRHTIRMLFEGLEAVDAAEILIAELAEHEFAIPGQLVADAAITGVEHDLLPNPRMVVDCELLLLVDA